jgi:hypothetical protein
VGNWETSYSTDTITIITTTINTSGLVSLHPATIHYVEGGVAKTATTYGTWSGTPDSGSILSIDNPISVSATERYHSGDTSSWAVTGTATHSLTYYHQWKPTISVATAGTGHADLNATNYTTLTYYQYGSSKAFNVFDAQSFSDWVDIGSTASLANPSSGSTSTHRWHSAVASWVIDDASTRSATYWEQFKPTITTVGLSASHPASIGITQYGGESNPTAYATWSDWIDIGATMSISNRVVVSDTERYHSLDTTSWEANSAITPTVNYTHQFLADIAISGLSPSYPTTITVVQHGVTNNPTTSGAWSDWADADSSLSLESAVSGGWFGEKWKTGDTTSWVMDSSLSTTVSYHRDYTAYIIIIGVVAVVILLLTFLVVRRRRRAA